MKLYIAGLAFALTALTLIGYASGVAVSESDRRLFERADIERATMLASNCGASGRLLADPINGGYLCAWINPDGSAITANAPDYPYLDQLARQ